MTFRVFAVTDKFRLVCQQAEEDLWICGACNRRSIRRGDEDCRKCHTPLAVERLGVPVGSSFEDAYQDTVDKARGFDGWWMTRDWTVHQKAIHQPDGFLRPNRSDKYKGTYVPKRGLPPGVTRQQELDLRRMAKLIQGPADLQRIMLQVKPEMREAGLARIRPYLSFQLPEGFKLLTSEQIEPMI